MGHVIPDIPDRVQILAEQYAVDSKTKLSPTIRLLQKADIFSEREFIYASDLPNRPTGVDRSRKFRGDGVGNTTLYFTSLNLVFSG